MKMSYKLRVRWDDWNHATLRARESYIRQHGADEQPAPDIRVVTRLELLNERRDLVRTELLQQPPGCL